MHSHLIVLHGELICTLVLKNNLLLPGDCSLSGEVLHLTSGFSIKTSPVLLLFFY